MCTWDFERFSEVCRRDPWWRLWLGPEPLVAAQARPTAAGGGSGSALGRWWAQEPQMAAQARAQSRWWRLLLGPGAVGGGSFLGPEPQAAALERTWWRLWPSLPFQELSGELPNKNRALESC